MSLPASLRTFSVLFVGVLLAALGRAGPQSVVAQADVTEELWIRAAARRLAEDPKQQLRVPTEKAAGTAGWQAQVALLEAYARAGVWAPAELVSLDEDDRVEVAAAKLRVLPCTPASGEEFEGRLARGLTSRFSTERSSALQRAALWSLEVGGMGGRASGLCARVLSSDELPEPMVKPLFRLALKSGDGRRFDSLFALEIAGQELLDADRDGWDPVLGFFEEVVALPLSPGELDALRLASGGPGPLACVELVALVRDGLDVEVPPVNRIVPVITGEGSDVDEGELDEVVETLVDALTLRSPVSAPAQRLGRALFRAASREELGGAAKERCLRSAARLLPVEDVLAQAIGLDDEAALGVWDALERRDSWPRNKGLTEALAPWVVHRSIDVREAVIRAVGRRYAYAGRSDLEGVLLEALGDEDPTLRSLCFAWLAKAPGAAHLESQLFAAWKREGHGGESPTLTPRQGRWLAQLPRDRTAVSYRGALLDLLSLEGSAEEAVGAGSLELLGGFRGDAEVFERVAILLERSLLGLEAAAGYVGRLPFDASAARAVRILRRVDPVAAEPLIEGALRRSMVPLHGADARGDARPQLPKTSVGLLALTERGRLRLAALQGEVLPRRVRFEVALQLAKRGFPPEAALAGPTSIDVLMGDFGGVDGALRLRAIEALGLKSLPPAGRVDDFLMNLTGVGNDEAERSTAIEALGHRCNLAGLVAVLDAAIGGAGPDAGTIDAAANAARALWVAKLPEWDVSGELNFATGRRRSRSLPAARVAFATLTSPELALPLGEELETIRGALLESLCALVVEHGESEQAGAVLWLGDSEVDAVLDAVLEGPIEAARLGAPLQFRSGRRVEAQFLWASELAALKTLGRNPLFLRKAVGGAERWGHLDGRTLLAMAQVAKGAGEDGLAGELATASAVALAGEGAAPDLQRRLAEARWMTPRSDRSLLAAYRQGRLARGVLRAMVPSVRRPEVLLHQRYWNAVDRAAPGSVATSRADAWSALD